MLNLNSKIKTECQRYFEKTYHLNIPDDWLNQCIDFLVQEFPNNQLNGYIDLILKQLLDFDLNEIGTSCLPNQLFNTQSGNIEGVYLLQIMLCIDAAQSYYSKLQKLIGDINENVLVDADNVPSATQFERKDMKKNRLITMFLSDGTRMIKAIEYRPISCLNEDNLPGTKVQIQGRMQFRCNVIFLNQENVKILGGTVEDMTSNENFIEMIQKELQSKRSNETPVSEREQIKHFKSTKIEKTQTNMRPTSYNNNNNNSQAFNATSRDDFMKKETFSQKQSSFVQSNTNWPQSTNQFNKTNFNNNNQISINCVNPMKSTNFEDDDDDDEILMNCDFESLATNKKSNSNTNFSKTNNNFNNNNNTNNNRTNNINNNYNETMSNFQSNPTMKRPPSSDSISNLSFKNTTTASASAASISNKNSNNLLINRKKMKIDEDEDEDDFLLNNLSEPSFNSVLNPIKINTNVNCNTNNNKIVNKNDQYAKGSSLTIEENNYKKQQQVKIKSENFYDDCQENFLQNNHQTSSTKSFKSYELMRPKVEINNFSKTSNIDLNFDDQKSINQDTNTKRIESLMNLTKSSYLESCCFQNKPSMSTNLEQQNLADCVHYIRGHFVTLTAKLRQFKLKWYQECIVTDGNVNIEVYIGDDPITQLLGLTCSQVKEMYKRSLEASKSMTSLQINNQNKNSETEDFEKRRKLCENKLENMICLMHLKYDFDKSKFCIFKIENVDLNSKNRKL